MALPALLLIALTGPVQAGAPPAILRARLVAREGTAASGTLTLRDASNHVYRCGCDSKTYFEKAFDTLEKEERLEVIADQGEQPGKCYARIVRILPVRSAASRPPLGLSRSPTEDFAPRGNLTFWGVVVKAGLDRLVLRTRAAGQQSFLLRPDTRFVADGTLAEPAELKVNTRVFVRCGRTLEGEIEVYQVMWGQILPGR